MSTLLFIFVFLIVLFGFVSYRGKHNYRGVVGGGVQAGKNVRFDPVIEVQYIDKVGRGRPVIK